VYARVAVRRGVSITDHANGALAVDLRDVLRIVGEDAIRSTWTMRGVECTGAAAEAMHSASDTRGSIDGAKMMELANGIDQVIEGEFAANLDPDAAWLLIRVVDSSAVDVITDRDDVLARLRQAYARVVDLPADALL
jgi:hypothetical protein